MQPLRLLLMFPTVAKESPNMIKSIKKFAKSSHHFSLVSKGFVIKVDELNSLLTNEQKRENEEEK